MLALHWSRFLQDSGPPGAFLQRWNAWVHQEPLASICAGLHWGLVLCFGAPMVGFCLPWMLVWELLRQLVWEQATDPKELQETASVRLAVVITGCDSGIGEGLAESLAAKGFEVFVGCLLEESRLRLENRPGMQPILLDVTKDAHVETCFEAVQAWLLESEDSGESRRLHAVINNAGIGRAGYFDWLSLADYEVCMKVNYFGPIRMIKRFLPLLKDQAIEGGYQHAKIVNIVSIAGILSGGGGFSGSAYEASKAAAEAFTNALRLEMKAYGIAVVGVNPSFVDTALTRNVQERLTETVWNQMAPETQEEYGRGMIPLWSINTDWSLNHLTSLLSFFLSLLCRMVEFFDAYARHTETLMTAGKWDPAVVVDSITHAILSHHPPAQLLVGLDARGLATFSMFPHWFRHLFIQLWLPPQTTRRLALQQAPSRKDPKLKRA